MRHFYLAASLGAALGAACASPYGLYAPLPALIFLALGFAVSFGLRVHLERWRRNTTTAHPGSHER